MRWLLIVACLFLCINTQAQNGYTYTSLKGGWISKNSFVIIGAMEFSGKYHSLMEVFGEYYKNVESLNQNYSAGAAYKFVLTKNKNSILRLKAGGSAGTNGHKFIAAPILGFEFSKSLKGIDLMLTERNQFVFWEDEAERWRWGIDIGFRIPIN